MIRMKKQRGVAVITALLLTTLAVTIVASLFWQQQVQVRSMENQRLHLQIQWILRGTLDWTKLILQQEAATQQNFVSLKDVWATPLANTRIDQYVDRERVAGETFDANLSGQIYDATAKFNLTNLADNGVVDKNALAAFKQLLTFLRLDPGLATYSAQLVANGQTTLAQTNAANQSSTPAKQMQVLTLEDFLEVPGFTADTVEALRNYAIVLPDHSTVNVNTTTAEVLSAVLGLQLAQGQALIAQRDRSAWNDLGKFTAAVASLNVPQSTATVVDVKSEWFLVQSWLKLDRASLNTETLINRKMTAPFKTDVIWIHQN